MKTVSLLAWTQILVCLVLPAGAATITVTTAVDSVAADGECSLREAIIAANTDSPGNGCAGGSGADEIVFAVDGIFMANVAGSGENASATGDLDVTGELTVIGNGIASTVIDGGGLDRVLETHGVDLTLRDLTIQGGSSPFGGGINHNQGGTLTLEDCQVTSNQADFGGGINNNSSGVVNVTRCTLSDNVAPDGSGGGLNNNSGGQVTLRDCEVSGNRAPGSGFGGGIANNSDGSVTVERCAVRGNSSGGSIGGGGIHNNSAGTVVVVESEISENTAIVGAGVNNNSNGTVSITNSTISGNTVTGAESTGEQVGTSTAFSLGAGVRINGSGSVELTYATVASNDGGGITDGGSSGGALLESTLVVDNVGGDCSGSDFMSLGENIDSDGSCGLSQPSDMPSTDPLLGPLANNGGATRTHALPPMSPALDSGDPAVCPALDQRSVARPVGAGCDVGAFELDAQALPVLEIPTLDTLALIVLAAGLLLAAARRLAG